MQSTLRQKRGFLNLNQPNTALQGYPMTTRATLKVTLPLLACAFISSVGAAQEAEPTERNLAQELTNPIASLYTLPLQLNFDRSMGVNGNGSQTQLNVQPLIPFTLNEEWHLISRTIIQFTHQQDVAWEGQDESGVGDVLQSLFFSPAETPEHGWIWGAGPAISLPTASKDAFGVDSWALGPTVVALKTKGAWTVGVLANHLWSLGDGSPDYNGSYVEPWVSYVLPSNTTVSVSAEAVYDWNADELSLPLNLIVDQLVMFGDQPVSIGAAAKYWADTPDGGPEGWGLRLQVTFIWPK
jgi:hypothetical protein